MERLKNQFIENVFADDEDPTVRKRFVQVPEFYGKTRVNERGQEVSDAKFVDCNTYRAIRHIANTALNFPPIDERGQAKWDKRDSEMSRKVLRDLKKHNGSDQLTAVVKLEDDRWKWVLDMAETRGMQIFRGHLDAVLDALKEKAKDEDEPPKKNRLEESSGNGEKPLLAKTT